MIVAQELHCSTLPYPWYQVLAKKWCPSFLEAALNTITIGNLLSGESNFSNTVAILIGLVDASSARTRRFGIGVEHSDSRPG